MDMLAYIYIGNVVKMFKSLKTNVFVEYSTGIEGVWESWSAYMRYISRLLLKFAKKVRLRKYNWEMIYLLWYILVSDRVGRCIHIYLYRDIAKAPPYRGDSAKKIRKFWELEIFWGFGRKLITWKVILKYVRI